MSDIFRRQIVKSIMILTTTKATAPKTLQLQIKEKTNMSIVLWFFSWDWSICFSGFGKIGSKLCNSPYLMAVVWVFYHFNYCFKESSTWVAIKALQKWKTLRSYVHKWLAYLSIYNSTTKKHSHFCSIKKIDIKCVSFIIIKMCKIVKIK